MNADILNDLAARAGPATPETEKAERDRREHEELIRRIVIEELDKATLRAHAATAKENEGG